MHNLVAEVNIQGKNQEKKMKPKIIITERGPSIDGLRIQVYDLIGYREDYSDESIAEFFGLTVEQVQVAYDYVEANKAEVMAEFDRMMERSRRGNSPEIRAKLEKSHQKFLAMQEEFKRRREAVHA